jgi:hypothetical protein
MVRGGEEDRFGNSPADRLILLEMPSPAQWSEHRVIEGGAAVEVGDLQEDVVQHLGRQAI